MLNIYNYASLTISFICVWNAKLCNFNCQEEKRICVSAHVTETL